MKAFKHINPLRPSPSLPRRLLTLALAASATLALTGCLSLTIHKRAVSKTVVAPHVLDATLQQLNSQIGAEYALVKTVNAKVTIQATTGGHHQGEVQEIPTFSGFILMRKPSDLRTIMTLPLVGSLALDMVSDGKTFKLVVPPRKIAREGAEEVSTPSPKGFENLRPNIIRDALLVPPATQDEFVSLTQDSRLLPGTGKGEMTEEPDYDLTISRVKKGNELQTVRVIHVSRTTLKPYQQDIYDEAGRLVTTVAYDRYQQFGDIVFPLSIVITRPIDEYALKIDISKLTLNQDMDDEQFVLKFPEGITVQKM